MPICYEGGGYHVIGGTFLWNDGFWEKPGWKSAPWALAGRRSAYQEASLETVERLLGSALDAGLNVIDTAECYAGSEELIGKAVGHRREQFHLFTKCGHSSGLPGEDWDPADAARRALTAACSGWERTAWIWSSSTRATRHKLRQGDVIAVLQEAREAGKTRFIGYSGDREAARYAVECGAFDTLQTSVSIADQQPITLTLPLALENGMGVIAKRPIANAAWTKTRAAGKRVRLSLLAAAANAGYDFLTGPDAVSVALRFTLAQPAVATAIVGTQNPDRWLANARLLDAGPLPPRSSRRFGPLAGSRRGRLGGAGVGMPPTRLPRFLHWPPAGSRRRRGTRACR